MHLFKFLALLLNVFCDQLVVTIAPVTTNSIMLFPARLPGINPLSKKSKSKKIFFNYVKTNNVGLNFAKTSPQLKAVDRLDFTGFYKLSNQTPNDLLKFFTFSFRTDEEHKKDGLFIKKLDSEVDGPALFSFTLKEVSRKHNITAEKMKTIFAIPENDIQKYKNAIFQATRDADIHLHAIIPQSLAFVMSLEERGILDNSFATVVTSNESSTVLSFFQVVKITPDDDKSDEEQKDEKKEESSPLEGETKDKKKDEKKDKKKKKKEQEEKTQIKFLFSKEIPGLSNEKYYEIIKNYCKEVVTEYVRELIERRSDLNRNFELCAWPFDENNELKEYFFNSAEFIDKIPFQLHNYVRWESKDKSDPTYNEEGYQNAKIFERISIEIFNKDNKLIFGLSEVKFDLSVLHTRISDYLDKISKESRKIEKDFFETAVKMINHENITVDNLSENMKVLAIGQIFKEQMVTSAVFDKIEFKTSSYEKNWAKGGSCLLIYDVEDERVVYADKETPALTNNNTFTKLNEEVDLRSRAVIFSKKLTKEYKKIDKAIEEARWERYADLLRIHRAINNKEHVQLKDIRDFVDNFSSVKFNYVNLPKNLAEMRSVLDFCKKEMAKNSDLKQMLETEYNENENWFKTNIPENATEENLQFELFFDLQKRAKDLNFSVRTYEKIIREKKDRERLKKLKEEQEKKEAEKAEKEKKETTEQTDEDSATEAEASLESKRKQDEAIDKIQQEMEKEEAPKQEEEKKTKSFFNSVADLFTGRDSDLPKDGISTQQYQSQLKLIQDKVESRLPALEDSFNKNDAALTTYQKLTSLRQKVKESMETVPEDSKSRREKIRDVRQEYDETVDDAVETERVDL